MPLLAGEVRLVLGGYRIAVLDAKRSFSNHDRKPRSQSTMITGIGMPISQSSAPRNMS